MKSTIVTTPDSEESILPSALPMPDESPNDPILNAGGPSYVEGNGETTVEIYLDIVLGVLFLLTAIVAARRMSTLRRQPQQSNSSSSSSTSSSTGGAERVVITAFYSLILLTSVLRATWFLIPASTWQPSYVPVAVYAWDAAHPSWVGAMLSEVVVTAGSIALFAIFILILVYWADILEKYFHPGSRRSVPMVSFITRLTVLLTAEAINIGCFLCQLYTTEGMVLVNAVLLAIVSVVCVCRITFFSHRFRTVLKTLGAINQVSTDSQVRRIVWITVTGNAFFFTRAFLESYFCAVLVRYWHTHGTVAKVFSHTWWDIYTVVKYGSEWTILALMFYILQSRFNSTASATGANGNASKSGYRPVPNAQDGDAAVVV
jgi:hypothetical protein